jgi:hypothetical protein
MKRDPSDGYRLDIDLDEHTISSKGSTTYTTMSLLSLPQEVRDQILDLVLIAQSPPPRGPCDKQERQPTCDFRYHVSLEAYKPNATGLLLTNHQLSAETKQNIQRKKDLAFRLDVMVVQERELWPTWTSIPCSNLNLVDTVKVTFRIFGPPHHLNHEFSLFRPGDGGPPVIAWQFNDLLKRFVCVGPTGPIKKPEEAYARSVCGPSDDCYKSQEENKASVKHPFIKHLRLNALTPTIFPEDVQIAPEFARAERDV